MKRTLLLMLAVGLMVSCSSEKPSEPTKAAQPTLAREKQIPATATPIVPSLEEIQEVLKSAGGRAIGVTNENLYVIDKVELISYKPQDETTCLIRLKVSGTLSEPWLNMNEAYQKGQELIYKGEYELHREANGRWKFHSIRSLQRVNIEESPATIVTPPEDTEEDLFEDDLEGVSPEL